MFFSPQTVDNLALLDMAAVQATLTGAFDSRIKELRGMLDQIAAHEARVKALADAEKIKESAEALLVSAKEAESSAARRHAELSQREDALRVGQAKLQDALASLAKDAADLDAQKDAVDKKLAAAEAWIANNQHALGVEQARMAKESAQLQAERNAFNAKLAALKA